MIDVLIIDKIGGNVGSVYKTLKRLKANVICGSSEEEIRQAKRIIMPGVGHFENAINKLKEAHIIDVLYDKVIIKKNPVLGICLGMQLMTEHSEEGDVDGLGWFPSVNVKRFHFHENKKYKVPHIGWNTIESSVDCALLNGITERDFFYFVHSYYVKCANNDVSIAVTNYEQSFTSVIAKDNIFGVQFHPEKSYDAGDKLLINFLNL